MSEYWVSKKKYFCKYCDIYIADDVPSRQHHENGLRHKGNLERFVRGIYKAGEKQKKDKEDEIREMKRVELAAAAAFAQDIGAGIAKPSSSLAFSTTAKKPRPKPSNAYENYSTAASLGYTDPDADRLAEEMRIRQTQGVAGEWEVVSSTTRESPESSSRSITQQLNTTASISTTADMTGGADVGIKREAEGPPAEDDIRAFKLRKKQLTAGLGKLYDPGLIPIKVKRKEEQQDTPLPGSSSSLTTESEPIPQTLEPSTSIPKTTVQPAKRPDQDGAVPAKVEEDTKSGTSSKWAKAKWSEPIPDIPVVDRTSLLGLKSQESDLQPEGGKEVKSEGENLTSTDAVPNDEGGVDGIKFKRRRAPVNVGRGRREI